MGERGGGQFVTDQSFSRGSEILVWQRHHPPSKGCRGPIVACVSPAVVITAGHCRQRSRGSHSTMWVAPSSAGRSSLTRRQRSQFAPNSGAASLRFT